MLSLIKNVLAALGLLFLLMLVAFFARGWGVANRLEPASVAALQAYANKVLSTDLATAGIAKIPCEGGVSLRQAMQAMKREAKRRRLKLVAEGVPSNNRPKLAILNFCDSEMRAQLFAVNPAFIPHMPCRVTLYEDQQGILWASAVNLDLLLATTPSQDSAGRAALAAFNEALVAVMNAGAYGKPAD